MPTKTVAPYGSWKTPISPDMLVSTSSGIGRATQIALDGDDVYWAEARPQEGGRVVVVRRSADGAVTELTPAPYNVRTTVYEYGGGAYAVSGGVVYFSNFGDQRLYRQAPGGAPEALTPESGLRYADGVVDAARNLFFCVREDHSAGSGQPVDTIARVDLTGGDGGAAIVSGNDFYSAPRLSPDGGLLAWVTWDHPNMQWDASELWVAQVDGGGFLGERAKVAGGPGQGVASPAWTPGGDLVFLSERTGWLNLYRYRPSTGSVEPLMDVEAEIGGFSFGLGASGYAVESDGRIVCVRMDRGSSRLAVLDTESGGMEYVDTEFSEVSHVKAANGQAFIVGGSPEAPESVVRLDLETGEAEVLRSGATQAIDSAYLSVPEPVEFPTEDGLTAHAFYYAPSNADFEAPAGTLPPLIVISHGGPTGATSCVLDLSIQFWASRGFGVVDVNYGGSTGFGREYRERLRDRWGIVDVDDCVNAAKHLIERGSADPDRVLIRGGSAGGYTTLASLAFRDFYKAGASYYGLSDLEGIVKDTHKLESQYLDGLIGPYPERRDVYMERSPVHSADRINCPLILFQGLEDKAVPPSQAEYMLEAMRSRGLPVAYVPFADEQHGFRRAENIKQSIGNELYFYCRVFGIESADSAVGVEIENL